MKYLYDAETNRKTILGLVNQVPKRGVLGFFRGVREIDSFFREASSCADIFYFRNFNFIVPDSINNQYFGQFEASLLSSCFGEPSTVKRGVRAYAVNHGGQARIWAERFLDSDQNINAVLESDALRMIQESHKIVISDFVPVSNENRLFTILSPGNPVSSRTFSNASGEKMFNKEIADYASVVARNYCF
jgi:hypothetical protein